MRKLTFTTRMAIKKRIVYLTLVFLWMWPVMHHLFVASYDMDPWLYFGISMYATPRPIIGIIGLEAAYPAQTFQGVNQNALRASASLQRSLHRLVDGRSKFGTLYKPETVVKEMFDEFPSDIDRLAFTMQRLRLDAKGILVAQNTRIECRKGEKRGEVECAVVPVDPQTKLP